MQTTVPASAGSLRCQRCGVQITYKRKDRVPTYCWRGCVGPKTPKWDRSPRACQRCRQAYLPVRPEQRWCSDKCRNARVPSIKPCALCGKGFRQMFATGRFSYCSRECAANAKSVALPNRGRLCEVDGCDRQPTYARSICESHRNAARFGKPCLRCGLVAQRDGDTCRTCSSVLANIGKRCAVTYSDCQCGAVYVNRGRRHCTYGLHVSRSGKLSTYVPVEPHETTCHLCKQTFIAFKRRLCDSCVASQKRKFKRASKRKRANSKLIKLAAVYGNRCHLCRRPVRWDVHHQHDLYPSRDHLVPESEGGPGGVNLALAHRICNSRRGVGGSVQLRLL